MLFATGDDLGIKIPFPMPGDLNLDLFNPLEGELTIIGAIIISDAVAALGITEALLSIQLPVRCAEIFYT